MQQISTGVFECLNLVKKPLAFVVLDYRIEPQSGGQNSFVISKFTHRIHI